MKFDTTFCRQFDGLLHWRRNEVEFADTPVDDADLDALLDSANTAPSVGLSQPWKYVVVRDPARREAVFSNYLAAREQEVEKLDTALRSEYIHLPLTGLMSAPLHVAFFLDNSEMRGRGLGYTLTPLALNYSVAISAFSFWLAAQVRNMAVGWVSILDEPAVNRLLDVPADWQLVAYLCLGYSSHERTEPDLETRKWSRREVTDKFVIRR